MGNYQCCILICPWFTSGVKVHPIQEDVSQASPKNRMITHLRSYADQVQLEQNSSQLKVNKEVHEFSEASEVNLIPKTVTKVEIQLQQEMEKKSNSYQPDFHLSIDTLKIQQVELQLQQAVELEKQGKTKKAEQIYKEVLKWIEKEQDLENKEDVVAGINSSLAWLLSRNKPAEFLPYLTAAEQAFKQQPAIYSEEHITLLSNIATNLYIQKKYHQAKNLFQKALELAEKYFFSSDERKYSIINNLICLQFSLNQFSAADKMYKLACQDLQKFNSEDLLEMKSLLKQNYEYCSNKKEMQLSSQKIEAVEPVGAGMLSSKTTQ